MQEMVLDSLQPFGLLAALKAAARWDKEIRGGRLREGKAVAGPRKLRYSRRCIALM
jgi:hypothetical protein